MSVMGLLEEAATARAKVLVYVAQQQALQHYRASGNADLPGYPEDDAVLNDQIGILHQSISDHLTRIGSYPTCDPHQQELQRLKEQGDSLDQELQSNLQDIAKVVSALKSDGEEEVAEIERSLIPLQKELERLKNRHADMNANFTEEFQRPLKNLNFKMLDNN